MTNSSFAAFSQAGELILTDLSNGFKGTFKSGNQALAIDSTQAEDRSLRTTVTNSAGTLVVQALYSSNLVTVTVSDISIKFRIDRESIVSRRFEPLSPIDQARLEKYLDSDESRIIRKMFLEIIKSRAGTKPSSLKGILIISLIMGDGPGFSGEVVQTNSKPTKCSQPKVLQIFAAYAAPKKTTDIKPFSKILECNETNCCGCCGPGCGGCTGCYTTACLLHDICVDTYGALHPTCMVLLADAIASILDVCPNY
jgi:hypothetical protein